MAFGNRSRPDKRRNRKTKRPDEARSTNLNEGRIKVVLGKTKRPGDRRFMVSIASNLGGGRQLIWARTPEEAVQKAGVNAFSEKRKGLKRSTLSAIVTDNKTKKQTFF